MWGVCTPCSAWLVRRLLILAAGGDRRMERDQFDGLGGLADVAPQLAQRVKAADDKLVAFVRERPVTALAAALLAGYLVGRVVSRLG
jgi:hypothetical protein